MIRLAGASAGEGETKGRFSISYMMAPEDYFSLRVCRGKSAVAVPTVAFPGEA